MTAFHPFNGPAIGIQAGWYPDPADSTLVRYWDGTQWTDDVQKSFERAHADRKTDKKRARGEKRDEKRQEKELDRPDIKAAADRMSWKLGSKREVRKLAEHLRHDETTRMITSGHYGPGRGVVVLTDKRLFFLKDGVMNTVSEDFPLTKISSIQWSSGMVFGKITVFVSGNQSIITNMAKDDGKAIVDAIRADVSGLRENGNAPQAPVVSPEQDPIAQLKALGELRDAGVLTDGEFESKKAYLLGQIGGQS